MLRKIANIFSNPRGSNNLPIELSYEQAIAADNSVFDMLQKGHVLVIRGMEPIFSGREKFIEHAASISGQQTRHELADFYAAGKTPSMETMCAVSDTVKHFRKNLIWSRLLHIFLSSINATGPVL